VKRRKGLLDEEKFLPPLPEQLPRGVSSLPGYGQTSPIAQGLLGYTGRQPTYSVMDPEAQKMSEAYRLGEQASVASQLYGSVAPVAVASAMANAQRAGSLLSPLTVFHGSPHKFSKFDASKIGTGEGAQVYGHGLYFAENPGVAKSYQVNLTQGNDPRDWINNIASSLGKDKTTQDVIGELKKYPEVAQLANDKEIVNLTKQMADGYEWSRLGGETWSDSAISAMKKLDARLPKPPEGAFYKADLPDEEIAKMLDWDKPLSQQPKAVQDALNSSGLLNELKNIPKIAAEKIRVLAEQPGIADWAKYDLLKDASSVEKSPSLKHVAGVLKSMQLGYGISPDSGPFAPVAKDFLNFVKATQIVPNIETGGGTLGMLEAVKGGPREAARALREAGIPGIRYLDQGSRGTGKGTSNFVVFPGEESKVRIMEINGKPVVIDEEELMRSGLLGQ